MTSRKYAYDLAFQSATERLAFSPQAGDVGKVAKQVSDGSFWVISSVSPVTWLPLRDVEPAAKLITVMDVTAPLHSSNVSQTLVDEWADLGEYGVLLSSNTCYCNAWFEKPDGQGGWIPVVSEPSEVPGVPSPDAPGYTVEFAWVGDNLHAPVASWVMTNGSSDLGPWMGSDPSLFDGSMFWTDPQSFRTSRCRMIARSDCSSGLHDAKGYRFRMSLKVPDYCVWSREVPIPEAVSGLFFDEPVIDLSELGLSSYASGWALVAVFKRNGRVIHVPDARQSLTGEPCDPPAYPVRLWANVVIDGVPWWNPQNSGNVLHGPLAARLFAGNQAGDLTGALGPNDTLFGGVWLADSLGQCTEFLNDKLKLAAWRVGPALTEYIAEFGSAPVAVPNGSAAGATILFKILKAPPYLTEYYPFDKSQEKWEMHVPGWSGNGKLTISGKNYDVERRGLSTDGRRLYYGGAICTPLIEETPSFLTDETVGTGAVQVFSHGFKTWEGFDPNPATYRVRVVPTQWPGGSQCSFTIEKTETEIRVTMTNGVTYFVMAWPPSPI